jgi:nitrogenase molybdenum-cofactor synthesis protein NifE
MGRDALMLEDGNPRALIEMVRDNQVDVLIAGGRNMYTALKARIPFLDINQEREFGYAGYTGMLELARQLVLTIDSPIWSSVREPAPWASLRKAVQPLDPRGDLPAPAEAGTAGTSATAQPLET